MQKYSRYGNVQFGILFLLLIVFSLGLAVYFFTSGFKTSFKPRASNSSSEPSLTDFWNGSAQWKFYRSLNLANAPVWQTNYPSYGDKVYGFGAGSHFEVVDGVWYHFSRKIHWGEKPEYCKAGGETFGVQVRKSTNKGLTWSEPVEIISPEKGTPWECGATDGDAWFDRGSNTWRYLFQCLNGLPQWQGCYLERPDPDPMGKFVSKPGLVNPVIKSGALWSKICNSPQAKCTNQISSKGRVVDEGTFDIIGFDGKYYWVTFHGFDYVSQLGFRGEAKTTNFVDWIAGDLSQGVPNDAILTRDDSKGWFENWDVKTGPIGFGSGRTIQSGGYYYTISESADLSLGCTDGQKWDWGLFRGKTLSNLIEESYPNNPVLFSSLYPERNGKSIPCNPAYVGIFKDDQTGKLYLHQSLESGIREKSGIIIYELVPKTNLLVNGDFFSCRMEPWSRIKTGSQDTNYVLARQAQTSSDGNCHMIFNCGATVVNGKLTSCNPGQSIYQDIPAPTGKKTIIYGGKVSTQAGKGTLILTVFQLGDRGQILKNKSKVLNVSTGYVDFADRSDLDVNARTIRYQIYLQTQQNFYLDEAYLNAE